MKSVDYGNGKDQWNVSRTRDQVRQGTTINLLGAFQIERWNINQKSSSFKNAKLWPESASSSPSSASYYCSSENSSPLRRKGLPSSTGSGASSGSISSIAWPQFWRWAFNVSTRKKSPAKLASILSTFSLVPPLSMSPRDVNMLAIPLVAIWGLHMPMGRKFGIGAIFAVGIAWAIPPSIIPWFLNRQRGLTSNPAHSFLVLLVSPGSCDISIIRMRLLSCSRWPY